VSTGVQFRRGSGQPCRRGDIWRVPAPARFAEIGR